MIEALLVMANSYLHDLAVAFLFASSLLAHVVVRNWAGEPPRRVGELLRRIAWWSLAWVLVGGAIRAWFFREYEWSPRAGTAQVPALVAKHVFMVALTVWGLAGVVRLKRELIGLPGRDTRPTGAADAE